MNSEHASQAQANSVLLSIQNGVAFVTLNRPERLNAWDPALPEEFLRVLNEVRGNPAVRVVVLTGSGRSFSTGADLQAIAGSLDGFDIQRTLVEQYNPLIVALRSMPQVVIAAVNGPAAGAGCGLALACDLVVAKESAFFLLAFARIGLALDGGSSAFVAARVGFTRAAELAFLADPVGASQAQQWGLINHVFADEDFDQEVQKLAKRLADGPYLAYQQIKNELNNWVFNQLDDQLHFEASSQAHLQNSPDLAEGIAAFTQKRVAVFNKN